MTSPRLGAWVDGSRTRSGRLRAAAMELYVERGYEQTTVAEIAERAGLTARTFFRYFADKREVLFAGSDELQDAMVGALVEPRRPSAAPMDAVAAALDAAAELLGGRPRRTRASGRPSSPPTPTCASAS